MTNSKKSAAIKTAANTVADRPNRHTGVVKSPIKIPAMEVKQLDSTLYGFKAKASLLFQCFSINRRAETKDEGYQRVLSPSRVAAVTRYISERRKPIPGAIVVSLDEGASYDSTTGTLVIPSGTDVGWVIDGQHRIAGAAIAAKDNAKNDIELAVVAFIGLPQKAQIEQFITINREAKNVPASLYLELLNNLSHKSPSDQAKERATDIATELRRDENSPFFEKIAVTSAPKAGQISLVNFVRKI